MATKKNIGSRKQKDYESVRLSSYDLDRIRFLKEVVKVPQVSIFGFLIDERERLTKEVERLQTIIKKLT
jgi:hypothetical protein